jgi:hypothetical protein
MYQSAATYRAAAFKTFPGPVIIIKNLLAEEQTL